MKYIHQDANTLVIARPLASRLFIGFFGLLFAAMCLALVGFGIQQLNPAHLASRPGPRVEHAAPVMLLFLLPLMCLAPTAMFFYYAGEERLECDLTTRIYRYRRGLPFFIRESSGSFNDLGGLYIKRQQSNSVTQFLLYLTWNVAGRSDLLAGSAGTEEGAQAQAQALADKLRLPVSAAVETKTLREARPVQSATTLISLFPVGIALMYFLLFLPSWYVERRLDQHGVQTQGVISNPKSHSHIYYTFQVNGRPHQGETHTNYEKFVNLRTGEPVTVRYMPDDPQTNHILGGPERRGANFGIGFGVLMLLLSPSIYLLGRKRTKRQSSQPTT